MTTGKTDEKAAVLDNRQVADGYYQMLLAAPLLSETTRPGQFFQLQIGQGRTDPLLRRPFAPSDAGRGEIGFVYAVVGRGTALLREMKEGDAVRVLGPLGKPFDLPETPSVCLVAGGGCGAPSLLTLARALVREGHQPLLALGARTGASLPEPERWREIDPDATIATDDGSEGFHGTVVDALSCIDGIKGCQAAYACGPVPMLKGIAGWAGSRDIRCQVSLEARMACGFGACMGCVIKVRDQAVPEGFRFVRVCTDGPVFEADQVVWG